MSSEQKHARRLTRARARVARVAHPGLDATPLPPCDAVPDGATLAARIAARGPLAPDEARTLAHDVLAALAEAHADGLVHGALSAAHVRQDRDRWVVSGLAEALVTARTHDEREDVRGVGAVLYEALTGNAPLAAGREALPDGLRATVLRCLQRDPERRYASARELAVALGAPLPPPTPRPRRRHARVAVVAACGLATGLALAGGFAWRHHRHHPVAAAAAQVPARIPRVVVALATRGRFGDAASGRLAAQAAAVVTATLEASGTVDVLEWDPARPVEDAASLGAQAVVTIGEARRGGAAPRSARPGEALPPRALELDLVDVATGARALATRLDAPARAGDLATALAPTLVRLGATLEPPLALAPPLPEAGTAWDAFLGGLEAEAAGELDAARLAHERAAALAPAFVAPRLRLVRLLAADGREVDAATVARELLALPGLTEDAALWARAAGGASLPERRAALAELADRRPADGAIALELAALARRLGDATACRTEAARAGSVDPARLPAARALGARCALEAGDATAAAELATGAGELVEGDLALATGRYGTARDAYRQAAARDVPGAAARALLVDVHGTGRCRLALDAAARQAHRTTGPARATLAWSWGQAAATCGDWTQGREAADWARRAGLTSEAAEIQLWLDATRGARGAFARARTWASAPSWSGVPLERGRRFGALARAARTPADAADVLALVGAPAWTDRLTIDAPPLGVELARLRVLAGDLDGAAAGCEDALVAAPGHVPPLACRAAVATARGDHAAAYAALRELLDRYASAEAENLVVRDARKALARAITGVRDQRAAAPTVAVVPRPEPLTP